MTKLDAKEVRSVTLDRQPPGMMNDRALAPSGTQKEHEVIEYVKDLDPAIHGAECKRIMCSSCM